MANEMKFKIFCVGAGGTGGYFLKEFSRFLGGPNKLIRSLNVIDGDIVEEHNLQRQAFQEEDIGQYKASVLAEVLNDTFCLDWRAFPMFLTSVEQIDDILSLKTDEIPILLGCVDNHGCRLVLEEYFRTHDNCIYFDSANEIQSGEVVLSYKLNGKQVSQLRSEIFPDILKGDTRNVTEMSCEELNTVTPQHITVNMMAGLALLSSVVGLIQNQRVRPGMICFNSFDMSSEYIPLGGE